MRPARGRLQGSDRPPTALVSLTRVKAALRLEGPPGDARFIFRDPRPDRLGAQRFLFTTRPYELTESDVWEVRARSIVNKLASDKRGRVLFCLDVLEDLPMAAIAFHYDGPDRPLWMRAIAERVDGRAAPSIVCVRVLKRYLHLFSLALDGPGTLLYDAPTGAQQQRARDAYEFRPARRPKGMRVGGRLLIQPAPGDAAAAPPAGRARR